MISLPLQHIIDSNGTLKHVILVPYLAHITWQYSVMLMSTLALQIISISDKFYHFCYDLTALAAYHRYQWYFKTCYFITKIGPHNMALLSYAPGHTGIADHHY